MAQLQNTTLSFYTLPGSAQGAVGLTPSSSAPSLPNVTQWTALLASPPPPVWAFQDIQSFTVELNPKGYHYTLLLANPGITGPIQQKLDREGDFAL
jgi:hypothetical protein